MLITPGKREILPIVPPLSAERSRYQRLLLRRRGLVAIAVVRRGDLRRRRRPTRRPLPCRRK